MSTAGELRKALSYLKNQALGSDFSDRAKVEYAEWLLEDALGLPPEEVPISD